MRVLAQVHVPIRIISHNIRYATESPEWDERPWADRRQRVINQLLYHTAHNPESLICLQEVLHQQLLDVATGLGSEWAPIGVGRDDGKQKGEYSPIFYRPSIWYLESWKTVWLSETPDRPGKGWDAASIRIVTVGVFQHRTTKSRVVGMNTHFDDQGPVSRRHSARLVLKVAEEVAAGNSSSPLPVFLAGDLNSVKSGEAYQILNDKESLLQDAKELSQWRYGDRHTYTGFRDSTMKTEIDHVFIGPRGVEGVWKVEGYSILPNRLEDRIYLSDHKAVVGDVVLIV